MKRTLLPLLALGLLAASATAQTTHVVNVANFQFTPAALTIEVGDTVVWENTEGFHNVNGTTASYPDNPESFGNALAGAPWTYEYTFTVAGEYGYHCDAHGAPGSGMFGAITVNPAPSPAVTVDIEPLNPPIVVPPAGGPVRFSLTFTNTTSETQNTEFWLALTTPSGSEITLVARALSLGPNQVRGPLNVSVNVPGGASAGTYVMTLNVGDFPATVEDSDSFTFEKAAPLAENPTAQAHAVYTLDGAEGLGAEVAAEAESDAAPEVVAYPNPATGQAAFRFTLGAAAEVRLAVYDALGREVAVLVDGPVEAGAHAASLDASALPSGVYVYRLAVDGRVRVGQLTLVR